MSETEIDAALKLAGDTLAWHAEFRATQPHAVEIADSMDEGAEGVLCRAVLALVKELRETQATRDQVVRSMVEARRACKAAP